MKKRFRILVADDEPDILESIDQLLEIALPDAEVMLAHDGVEAIGMMRSRPPDLILSDYKMPGIDGISFLTEAKRMLPDTPRLLITAYPDPGLAARAVREAGVGLFVAKPFNVEYLVEVLKAFAPSEETARPPRPSRAARREAATETPKAFK